MSLELENTKGSHKPFSILTFSDWRTQKFERILDLLDRLPEMDLIVYAGDDLERLKEFGIKNIANKSKYGLAGVAGNDDTLHFKDIAKRSEKVFDLHESPIILDNYAFLGLEGSTKGPGVLKYDENEVCEHLNKQYEAIFSERILKTILVSHTPPFSVLDFSMRFGAENIGSISVKEFLDSKEIDCLICGHSHLNGGKHERYNKTYVLNVSSHDDQFAPGNVAVLRLAKEKFDFQFFEILFSPIIKSELSILQQVGRGKRLWSMWEKGITKLDDINEKNRELLKTLPGVYDWHVNRWLTQIKAIKQGEVFAIKNELTNILQSDEIICYDIETNIENDRIWLIGCYNFQTDEFIKFFEKDDELKCLKQFLEYLEKYDGLKLVSYSNCKFEQRRITERSGHHNLWELVSIVNGDIDLGINISDILIGNIEGYSLKDLGNYFGYHWEDPDLDGLKVGIAYTQYLNTGKEIDWDKYIRYNKDDVLALKEIIMKIRDLTK
jgi:Icc-related predicted phosphoesterase/uncharacterized protein YprB with RNaseH-like and TPR domain